MKKTKALGKGLRALFDENEVLKGQPNGLNIKLSNIIPNENQPRKKMEGIEQLAESIKEHGILQSIVLLDLGGNKYQIIAGERRWHAAKLAGLEDIPAVVKNALTGQDKLVLGLVENLQREDLNPIEEAEAYQELIQKFNLSVDKLSRAFNKNRSTITNIIRLLSLPPQIRDDLSSRRIQPGHARPLINVKDQKLIALIRSKIINEELSAREVETLIQKYKAKPRADLKKKKGKNLYLKNIEEKFQKKLATKVMISGTNDKGKIIIEYYNVDDLNRFLEILNIN